MKYVIILTALAVLALIPILDAYAVNNVEQIIMVNGTITSGTATYDHDFSSKGSITNFDKTVVYMSFAHTADSEMDQAYRSWNLTSTTNLRFYASDDTPSDNQALDYIGYIIEYTSGSDVIVQDNLFSIAAGSGTQVEFEDLFTSVNVTRSNFVFSGQDHDGSEDLSWGNEEFARMRIINSTAFCYEVFDVPNTGPTNVRYQIIDWGNNDVEVQRGSFTMLEGNGSVTFSPPNPIQQNRTMVFMSHEIDGTADAEFDEHSYHATITSGNQVLVAREDDTCGAGEGNCIVHIGWETIEFKDGSIFVDHNLVTELIETGSNVQQIVIDPLDVPLTGDFNTTMAIGTVHTPLGLGQASSDSGGGGAWDRGAFTIELLNMTHTRIIFNDGQEPTVFAYQAIQFNQLGILPEVEFIFIPVSCCFFFLNPDLVFNFNKVLDLFFYVLFGLVKT